MNNNSAFLAAFTVLQLLDSTDGGSVQRARDVCAAPTVGASVHVKIGNKINTVVCVWVCVQLRVL